MHGHMNVKYTTWWGPGNLYLLTPSVATTALSLVCVSVDVRTEYFLRTIQMRYSFSPLLCDSSCSPQEFLLIIIRLVPFQTQGPGVVIKALRY